MLLLSKLSKLFRRTRKEALTQRAPSFEGLEGRTLFNVVTPAPPTNLTVNAASSTSASLHWSDNSTRESGYDIERSTDGKTFSQIKVTGASATSYTNTGLTKGDVFKNLVTGLGAQDFDFSGINVGGRVSFGWLSNDFHPDGIIGDPTAATAERGAELFAGSVTSFCEALREISTFDFGRCTPGGGTHRFKLQWGGADVPLPWLQWSTRNVVATPSPDRPAYKLAAAVWRRLPLAVTNRIGPMLARQLP